MKRIELSEPKRFGDVEVSEIVLRDPKGSDFFYLGFPVTWIALPNGGGFEQEDMEKIREWIERLYDGDPNVIDGLSLTDALALRDAVLNFFRVARAQPAHSTESARQPER